MTWTMPALAENPTNETVAAGTVKSTMPSMVFEQRSGIVGNLDAGRTHLAAHKRRAFGFKPARYHAALSFLNDAGQHPPHHAPASARYCQFHCHGTVLSNGHAVRTSASIAP